MEVEATRSQAGEAGRQTQARLPVGAVEAACSDAVEEVVQIPLLAIEVIGVLLELEVVRVVGAIDGSRVIAVEATESLVPAHPLCFQPNPYASLHSNDAQTQHPNSPSCPHSQYFPSSTAKTSDSGAKTVPCHPSPRPQTALHASPSETQPNLYAHVSRNRFQVRG